MDSPSQTPWSKISQLGQKSEQGEAAWRWFIERYQPLVSLLLGRRFGVAEAGQALEEFWGYLYSSNVFARADRRRSFRRYLFGVVENFARVRGRRSRSVPLDEAWLVQLGQADPKPDDEADTLWAEHHVRLALQLLAQKAPDQARAVAWFYGLPQPEVGGPIHVEDVGKGNGKGNGNGREPERLTATRIAELLGKNPGTVHQLLSRGRSRLRELLEAAIRETVGEPDALDDEVQLLLRSVERQAPGLLRF